MMDTHIALDNPIWYALTEVHTRQAIDFENMKFYHPDYCVFGSFADGENTSDAIGAYAALVDSFFIVGGPRPTAPSHLIVRPEEVCPQMIIEDKIGLEIREEIIQLDERHMDEVMALIKLVYPSFFRKKTATLGNYYGIYKNNQLAAITGERMQMNDYIEVSAVVTHPDHTGNGYAKQLVTHTVNGIFDQHKIPFLHVSETNTGAISLYHKLGFRTRKKISLWHIRRERTA